MIPEYFDYALLLRLVVALILGGIIGLEREGSNHDAGFRTHIVLCLGSATVMVVSELLALQYGISNEIMRMGAQVISGVGFLGAGSIVMSGNRLRGITTAAGLWTTACVGLAIGSGFYIIALTVVALMMFAMISLRSITKKMNRKNSITIKLELTNAAKTSDVISELIEYGVHVATVRFEEYDHKVEMSIEMHIPDDLTPDDVMLSLSKFSGVVEIIKH